MRYTTLLALGVALAVVGCMEDGQAPSTDESGAVPTPSAGIEERRRVIIPTDATWPEVEPTAESLTGLYPLSLRLEMEWPPERGEPMDAALWLVTADDEFLLPTNFTLGSVNYGPGTTGRETLTFNLSGGLLPIRNADPSLVESRRVTFAGEPIQFPAPEGEIALVARGKWQSDDGATRGFEQPLTLKPREGNLVVGRTYYNATDGRFGIAPHPGGFLHPLEDGALRAWAAGDEILHVGSSGTLFNPPGPPSLDLLVLTGMGGGVLTVEADG